MSRCKACDNLLNDFEMSRVDKRTGEFLDLCSPCYSVSEETRYYAEQDAADKVVIPGLDSKAESC